MKEISLIISIIIMDIFLYKIMIMNRNIIEIPIREIIKNYTIGIEGINIIMIGIIVSMLPIIIMIKKEGEKKVMIIMMIIIIMMMVQDIVVYYIGYEIMIIPIYYIITREGSRYKKYQIRQEAGIRILIYTIAGGMMILLGILIVIMRYGTTDNELMNYLIKREGETIIRRIINLIYLLSFFIKLPIYPFHIWLPMAHGESPTYGSVILAGIILKVASYGIIRYNLPIIEETWIENKILIILIIMSILIGGIIPIRGIVDIKKIVAYSSIVHMGISTIGIMIKEKKSIEGGIIIMITHGWISGGIFILIGLLYKRYKTRINIYYEGISNINPIFSILLILLILSNISIPISYGFRGELKIIEELRRTNIGEGIGIIIGIGITNMMMIITFFKIILGPISKLIKKEGYKEMNKKEIIIILPIIIYIYTLFWFPNIITSLINYSTIILSLI